MARLSREYIAGLAAAAAIASSHGAQPTGSRADGGLMRPVSLARDLRRVEAGVSDAGPLSTSLRSYSADLGVPDAFRDVYRVQHGPRAGQFARVAGGGGVVAVYPRGTYTSTSKGLRADIPNDTIFYIDGIPGSEPDRRRALEPSGAIPTRIDGRLNPSLDASGPIASHVEPIDLRLSTRVVDAGVEFLPGVAPTRSPADEARARAEAREQMILEREMEFFERGSRLFSDPDFRAQRVAGMLRGR
jgi:hypothetical protein